VRISKWVDFGAEVDIDIDFNDVRSAITEAVYRVSGDPSRFDVERALNAVACFVNGLVVGQFASRRGLTPTGQVRSDR
jgi:hypothetical protein